MALPSDFNLVEPERKADVLIDRLTLDQREHHRKRPRSFTAREALVCLEFEALLIATAASNVAYGVPLGDEDRQRIWLAYSRVQAIVDEIAG